MCGRPGAQCDASVNSWNSPVTRNAVCSPMSTALSPIRSMTAGDDDHAHPPLLRHRGARRARAPGRTTRRFVRSISSSSSTRLVGAARRRGRRRRRARRAPSPRRARPSRSRPSTRSWLGLEIGGELRQLGDRDALIADPLEVDRVVQDREHEPKVGRDGRLLREQLSDQALDPVVARVDLVVERDRPRRTARRPARSRTLTAPGARAGRARPCSWSVASSASRLCWNSTRAMAIRTAR